MSKHIWNKTGMHRSCTEKNRNKTEETYASKDRYEIA